MNKQIKFWLTFSSSTLFFMAAFGIFSLFIDYVNALSAILRSAMDAGMSQEFQLLFCVLGLYVLSNLFMFLIKVALTYAKKAKRVKRSINREKFDE